MNERFLVFQQEWFENNFKRLVSDSKGVIYSVPFVFGEPDLDPGAPKIMIIGQEPYDFPVYASSEGFDLKEQQSWTIRFLQKQVYGVNSDDKYENSPFWDLFRLLNKNGLSPTWNNVDKAHRLLPIEGTKDKFKTEWLWLKDEKILNESLKSTYKSLLQNEIEISKPDAIVFVTGPQYYKSMAASLQIEDKSLYDYRPRKCEPVKDITFIVNNGIPCLWSYHPKYLRMLGGQGRYFNEVVDKLKKIIQN